MKTLEAILMAIAIVLMWAGPSIAVFLIAAGAAYLLSINLGVGLYLAIAIALFSGVLLVSFVSLMSMRTTIIRAAELFEEQEEESRHKFIGARQRGEE